MPARVSTPERRISPTTTFVVALAFAFARRTVLAALVLAAVSALPAVPSLERPSRHSGRIRVNANGKRLDAWLIYRGTSCDSTWNRPVLERRPVSTIDPQLLASLQANDPDLSRRLAFATLPRKLEVAHVDDAAVRKEVVSASARPAPRLDIVCVVPGTTGLRVDRLLSTELRLSRSRIRTMHKAGRLAVCPDGLRRPLRNGLQVRIDPRGVHDGDEIALAAAGKG
jgi:hypothetical protein